MTTTVFQKSDWAIDIVNVVFAEFAHSPLAGMPVAVAELKKIGIESRPYLDMALMNGAEVTVITMETQFQNIHGVPEDKVQVMRNRMFDREHFMGTYKQVYRSPFTGDYIEYGKDDLCHTMQVLQSRTSSREKSNTSPSPKLMPA